MRAAAGFHDGELAVQARAGVSGAAARLVGMLAPPDLGGGASQFLGAREFAVLTARDGDGALWAAPMSGPQGFLRADGAVLRVDAEPAAGGPLAEVPEGQPVGLLVIDFETRRRMRVNGTLEAHEAGGLRIAVEQAFGNCPQYIQRRQLDRVTPSGDAGPDQYLARTSLDPGQADLIRRADTFFLGTVHPSRGADASHRGGAPGFVRVDRGQLWWPDYQGNNMFNSMGNLAVDPSAALLFLDFAAGRALHLSGTAVVEWTEAGAPGDDDNTGRRVRFTPHRIVEGPVALRAAEAVAYPRNPQPNDGPAPARSNP